LCNSFTKDVYQIPGRILMASKAREELRQEIRLFRAERRQERIDYLRRDFRFIAREAELRNDALPSASELMAKEFALPPDFLKVMDSLGMCTPKALRVARRAVELWYEIDSKVFISVFNRSFFDENGHLKSPDIGSLFMDLHASLRDEIRRMKDDGTHFVPLYKMMMKIDPGSHNDA